MASNTVAQGANVGPMSFDPSSFLTVRVGPEGSQQDFLLHEGVICARSEFFHRALNGNWAEKKERLVKLPEDDPKTFALYVNLLYTNVVSIITACQDMESDEYHRNILAAVELYVLAEKLQDKRAKNEALSTVLTGAKSWYNAGNIDLLNAEIVQLMYKNTLQGSLGRCLMVDLCNDANTQCILEHSTGICKEFFVDLAYGLHSRRLAYYRNVAIMNGVSAYLEEV